MLAPDQATDMICHCPIGQGLGIHRQQCVSVPAHSVLDLPPGISGDRGGFSRIMFDVPFSKRGRKVAFGPNPRPEPFPVICGIFQSKCHVIGFIFQETANIFVDCSAIIKRHRKFCLFISSICNFSPHQNTTPVRLHNAKIPSVAKAFRRFQKIALQMHIAGILSICTIQPPEKP